VRLSSFIIIIKWWLKRLDRSKKKEVTAESFDSNPAAFYIWLPCFKFGMRLKVGHTLDGTCRGINHTLAKNMCLIHSLDQLNYFRIHWRAGYSSAGILVGQFTVKININCEVMYKMVINNALHSQTTNCLIKRNHNITEQNRIQNNILDKIWAFVRLSAITTAYKRYIPNF